MNNKILDLASTAASLGGMAASNKALSSVWKKVTGNEPPAKNPDPEEAWTDIILWSLISGLVGTVVKVALTRQIAKMQNKDEDDSKAAKASNSQAEI